MLWPFEALFVRPLFFCLDGHHFQQWSLNKFGLFSSLMFCSPFLQKMTPPAAALVFSSLFSPPPLLSFVVRIWVFFSVGWVFFGSEWIILEFLCAEFMCRVHWVPKSLHRSISYSHSSHCMYRDAGIMAIFLGIFFSIGILIKFKSTFASHISLQLLPACIILFLIKVFSLLKNNDTMGGNLFQHMNFQI